MDVVLRDVLSGEYDRGLFLLPVQQFEGIAHRLEHGLGPEVRAADADADDQVGLGAQLGGFGLDGGDVGLGDRRGEVYPSQKVVAGALARVEQGVGLHRLFFHVGGDLDSRLADVQFYEFHGCPI
mgnify:FL=1